MIRVIYLGRISSQEQHTLIGIVSAGRVFAHVRLFVRPSYLQPAIYCRFHSYSDLMLV